MKDKIEEILDKHVDFAEWATDSSETVNDLLSLFKEENEEALETIRVLTIIGFRNAYRRGYKDGQKGTEKYSMAVSSKEWQKIERKIKGWLNL